MLVSRRPSRLACVEHVKLAGGEEFDQRDGFTDYPHETVRNPIANRSNE